MLKKFKKGQEAFLLRTNLGRNKDPEVKPVMIEKSGRKYITDIYGTRYEVSVYQDCMCSESDSSLLLFPSETEARIYLEKYQIWKRMSKISLNWRKYSVNQLKTLEEIMNHPFVEAKTPEWQKRVKKNSDKADILLQEMVQKNDPYLGMCQDILLTWNTAETEHERKSIEGMFLIFTGMEFKDFMERGGI